MEAAKLEKRRGRFKKNIEAVKNGTIGSEYELNIIWWNQKKKKNTNDIKELNWNPLNFKF